MKAYGTAYRGGFHATIWARSEDERDIMIGLRGLGEEPSEWCNTERPLASELFAKAMGGGDVRDIDVAHALVFLSFLASAAGLDPGLYDLGWCHEAIHWMALRTGPEWTETLDRIRAVERAIPGLVPGATRYSRNEYGTPVEEHTCSECGDPFTVCPAAVRMPAWGGCLAPECPSYDPARDAEVLFMTDAEVAALPVVDAGMLRARKFGGLVVEPL